ncbi:hypothetical protein MANES_10G064332v8 [Manihot esculenta]|uniref:Uncharacterized protein n=1 Tax=Manihot esculenta TaxID=3983 RepID=A0ACB7H072_MANES|nr:hypothetical protein MANES_10G064332v8 [Manihot esculenta]
MAVKKGKTGITCFQCGKSGHVKAQCYRLIGFPADFKVTESRSGAPSRNNSNHLSRSSVQQVSSASNETTSQLNLSKEQLQKLMTLLNDQNSKSINTSSSPPPQNSQVNAAGIVSSVLSSHTVHHNSKSCSSHSCWIVDTGATNHIIYDASLFMHSSPVNNSFVSLPNGQKVQVESIGSVQLNSSLILNDVMFIPAFNFNLLSASKLINSQHDLSIWMMIELAKQRGHCSTVSATKHTFEVWNHRLGHSSDNKLSVLQSKAKQRRLSFPQHIPETTSLFGLVHMDVWGPYSQKDINKNHYFLTVVDDFSKSVWTFLM